MASEPSGVLVTNAKLLLSITTVADMLDVSTRTVRRMVQEKRFPKPVRIVRGHPRWNRADVQTYLDVLRLGILVDGRHDEENDPLEPPVKG